MSSVEYLREFVSERLTAAAEEIFRVFKRTIVEYEEELERQRRLLDIVWKPEIRLHRTELPQQHVCKEEEVPAEQQLCVQERSSSLDQEEPEPPQIKEGQEELCSSQQGEQLVLKKEADDFILTPTHEGRDHSENQTMSLILDDNPSAPETEFIMPFITSVVSEPNSDHQLLSHKSHVAESQNHKEELPQQHVCKEEEVPADQQLCIQERSSSLDQEEPKPPQIKEEQEELCSSQQGEQLVLKKEEDDFILTPTNERRDHSENQTLDFNLDDAVSAAETESGNIPVLTYVIPEPNCVSQQLLSVSSHEAESKDQIGGRRLPKLLLKESNSHTNDTYNSTTSNIHLNTSTGEKSFKCDTCGKAFKCPANLEIHLRIHTADKLFTCKTCGRAFRKKSNLKAHMVTHTGEKPFTCETCGKAFRRRPELTVHMRTHTSEKPFTCQTCGRAFKKKNNLKAHMVTHTGEKPFTCETCGKDFRQKRHLTSHMRVHTSEKPFTCEVCGKAVRHKSGLTVHMRIHTGERPYTCKTCGKRFRQASVFKKHIKTHTGEKPFIVKTCGKAFQNCDGTVHMKTHTAEKPFACETWENFQTKL